MQGRWWWGRKRRRNRCHSICFVLAEHRRCGEKITSKIQSLEEVVRHRNDKASQNQDQLYTYDHFTIERPCTCLGRVLLCSPAEGWRCTSAFDVCSSGALYTCCASWVWAFRAPRVFFCICVRFLNGVFFSWLFLSLKYVRHILGEGSGWCIAACRSASQNKGKQWELALKKVPPQRSRTDE